MQILHDVHIMMAEVEKEVGQQQAEASGTGVDGIQLRGFINRLAGSLINQIVFGYAFEGVSRLTTIEI